MTSAARIITCLFLCLLGWHLTPAVSAQSAPTQTAEASGFRITLTDNYSFEVDAYWKQGTEIWYRQGSVSRGVDAANVKKITPLTKAAPEIKPVPEVVTEKKSLEPPAPLAIWIHLNGGARMRVDEVAETTDGAWYKRDNLSMFLDRERIARIEREQPGAGDLRWRESGWSSGNAHIDHLIKVNAARFGVDPYLIFCVIEQESQFKQFARSPKGAQGLMQLMPATARRLGVRRPYDPAENIMGGTRYLKELMGMFGGRVDLVLASYNAGEGAVMKYGRQVPPYRETREYVKKIGKRYGIDGRKPKIDGEVPDPQK